MRTIVNISLPKKLNKIVDEVMRGGKFATKSEFFRTLIRLWEQGKLAEELEASRRELKSGKGKFLHSLKDLR